MAQHGDDQYTNQQPIQIVASEKHTFILQSLDRVERILNSAELKDRYVIVVSIAGALRTGKSFLLNFFLKYLNARYKTHNVDDWINNDDCLENGFQWRGGKDRHTVGIWMWSEVFTYDFSNDVKVAIILMDTQGIFDNQMSMKECISIFAISMLLSSVQCFNVMRQVQEDDLNNLQLFTEYARLVNENTEEKPFQKLILVVRDWSSPYDHDFGASKDYVEDILSTNDQQTTKMHGLRHAIQNSFKEIDAFLMPYPGTAVAEQRRNSVIEIQDIDQRFIDSVEMLTEHLFAPDQLICKKICGELVRACDLTIYLKKYIKIFSSDELPKPITCLQATAEARLKTLYKEHFNKYLNEMRAFILTTDESSSDFLSNLSSAHTQAKTKEIEQFKNRRKLGDLQVQRNYMIVLEHEIDKLYKDFRKKCDEERQSKKTIKRIIMGSVVGGAATVGGVLSLIFPPAALGIIPLAVGAVGTASTAGGIGAGVAAGINALIPERKFINTFDENSFCEPKWISQDTEHLEMHYKSFVRIYQVEMKEAFSNGVYRSDIQMLTLHTNAKKRATSQFMNGCEEISNAVLTDRYLKTLENDIDTAYNEIKRGK